MELHLKLMALVNDIQVLGMHVNGPTNCVGVGDFRNCGRYSAPI
jgi:hypothetical protein